jgi:hypothetical protein
MGRIQFLIPAAAGTVLILAGVAATPSASAATTANGTLSAVSCAKGGSACVAVGYYKDSAGANVALAETASATKWKQVSFPLPKGATGGALWGVSCSSAKACTAVGSTYVGKYPKGHGEVLVGRWNGSRWTLQSAAAPSGTGPVLRAVSCTSSSSCMAVGVTETSAFAERWNGHNWSAKTLPLPKGADLPDASGLSCAGSACTGVGIVFDRSISDYSLPTAWRWTGSHWTVTLLPRSSSATHGSQPISDACSGASACSAAGLYDNASDDSYPYTVGLSGAKWKLQNSAYPKGATANELEGIACPSATDCVAVGATGAGFAHSLAETWNGHTWKVASSPTPKGASFISVASASCNSKSSCTAVGDYFVGSTSKAFAEHWNGSKWTMQSPVSPA